MKYPDFLAERAAFERERAALVRDHEGEYVVIIGDDIIATASTMLEAFEIGFKRAESDEFFTARITATPEASVLPAAVIWTP